MILDIELPPLAPHVGKKLCVNDCSYENALVVVFDAELVERNFFVSDKLALVLFLIVTLSSVDFDLMY
jgi:hypothetical protein